MLRDGYRVTAEYEANHWWFRSRRELFLAQIRLASAARGYPGRRLRLLDYGCGTGFNLSFLAPFGDVYGADLLDAVPTEFRGGEDFPLLDLEADCSEYHGRFDVLTALDVLEHLADDLSGLERMRRFVAPGGQMVLTVPAYRWLWSGEDVISRHHRRYTRRTLVRAARAAGLVVRYASYFNFIVLPPMAMVIWARRLRSSSWATESNLTAGPSFLNAPLSTVTRFEARMVGEERLRLPAGASLVCRLEVPA